MEDALDLIIRLGKTTKNLFDIVDRRLIQLEHNQQVILDRLTRLENVDDSSRRWEHLVDEDINNLREAVAQSQSDTDIIMRELGMVRPPDFQRSSF